MGASITAGTQAADTGLLAAQRLALLAVMGSAGRVWVRSVEGTEKARGFQGFTDAIAKAMRYQGPNRATVSTEKRAQAALAAEAETANPDPRTQGAAMAARAALIAISPPQES